MKLYYMPGSCSLSPHIVLRETGANFELEKVSLQDKTTASGGDFTAVNPKGQIPALVLDDGELLTEGPAIVQYLADRDAGTGLAGAPGTMERVRVQEWLSFVSTELHKSYGPMFRPTTPDAYKDLSRENLKTRYDWIDRELGKRPWIAGDCFTVADAYLFTVTRWAPRAGIDTAQWPNLTAYMARVAARPKVQEALKAEGLA